MDSVSVCNFSSKCEAGASIGRKNVNGVELGDVRTKGSVVCDGIAGGDDLAEVSALLNDDEISAPSSERDSNLSGNGVVQTVTVKRPAKESDDVSLSRGPSSLTDIEISGNGINLFVEVFGPSDGASESNSNNGGEQECSFEVGDLVWVKTRTPLWWPGMIHNPSDGPNDEMKPEKKGSFLVKYYGNTNFIWCNNSDLKPFAEYYEQLSGQKTSRNLGDAVEKALSDIGNRVNLEMTCPCFLKDKNEDSEENLNGKGKTHFEPLMFLTRVKELAGAVCPLGDIELTVLKNRLSCFYRSAGHLELPLQVLLEGKYGGCNSNDNNNNISGGCVRSPRAKKKSKFLSYPFEELGKNSKKKGLAKSLKDHHVISKADDVNAPSSKLLTELHSMACGYFNASKYSDSVRIFYSSFRSYAYLDADIADVEIKRKKERIKKAKESEKPGPDLESVNGSAGNNGVAKKISKKSKSLEKESVVMNKEDQTLFSMATNVSDDSSRMISFLQARGEANPAPPHGDVNKNNPIPVEEPSKNEGLVSPSINGTVHLAFANAPSSEDATQKIPPFFNVGVINDSQGEFTTRRAGPTTKPTINTGLASFDQQPLPPHSLTDFFPKVVENNKRKRDEKDFWIADFSAIPDLNGDMPDEMSPEMMSPSEKSSLPDGAEGKKRAPSKEEEDPGGFITLNFAPGSVLPPHEMLVSTFSRYGLVKGAEIRALNECTVLIPYERTPDVRFAYRSLERGHPFGESLLSINLHCQEEKKISNKKARRQNLVGVVPVKALKNPVWPTQRPPGITFMKKSVEAMRSTLKKTGDKIPDETRVNLEKEVRAFFERIGPKTGASSSSSSSNLPKV